MPLPLILGAGAAIAGVVGVGSGIHGASKVIEANNTMKTADARHQKNLARFEAQSEITNKDMDSLGKLELEILNSFEKFADIFEQIQNRPQFKQYTKEGVSIPAYSGETLKQVSIGAGLLLGGIGGAAVGTAGGFAAAGATTAAVMALGTASTGTAIASLSGAAATNAALAAIGGGSIAAGGGGMALGSTILGAATVGVGLLVGGVIFNITGSSLSHKADKAFEQMKRAEREIDSICGYLRELSQTAAQYQMSLTMVNRTYKAHLNQLEDLVAVRHKRDWNTFSNDEKVSTENTALLVGLLYNMCKVQLVLQAENTSKANKINTAAIQKSMEDAEQFLQDKRL